MWSSRQPDHSSVPSEGAEALSLGRWVPGGVQVELALLPGKQPCSSLSRNPRGSPSRACGSFGKK
eukprot:1189133-Amphidinium_carterae.1